MDLFSLLRCKPPQSSEQAVYIHFKTVLPTTIKNFHEGCYGRRPTKWQWSNKSCHLDTFYCFSGRLETSSSATEIPACTQKQFISSDLQTHTRKHTGLISIHTASRSRQREWFTEPETTRCVDGQTQLSAAPSDNHTHTINLPCKRCPAHRTWCACVIRRALW